MSHYTCLVIGEDPDALLAPYGEDFLVEPYRQYDDAARPQDFWLFDRLVAEGHLSVDADWVALIDAVINWAEGKQTLHYDAAADRVYEMSRQNPAPLWDYYVLGGRWAGFFDLHQGGRGDQARKEDIDFEATRARHGAAADAQHRRAMEVMAAYPPISSWEEVRGRWRDDAERANRAYRDQPGLRALAKEDLNPFGQCAVKYYHLNEADPRAAFVSQESRDRMTPFAIRSADGWMAKGRMTGWGLAVDLVQDWPEQAWAMIDASPGDAQFSLYDLHT